MATDAQYHPTIKELPSNERPRERLLHYGANALSNAELLAIILRTGTRDENVIRVAQRILANFGGLTGLAQANVPELTSEKGLGPAKAAQLKAALELGRRLLIESPEERPELAGTRTLAHHVARHQEPGA
jgi:DNA repair protein RadC